VHITIYKNKGGKPGTVVADFPAVTGDDNGLGTFALALTSAVKLKAGTYWISAQVNMDFLSGAASGAGIARPPRLVSLQCGGTPATASAPAASLTWPN
jgi:hypothetical protein